MTLHEGPDKAHVRLCCPLLSPLPLSNVLQLEDGSAEVFGTELQLGQSVAITGQKVAVGARDRGAVGGGGRRANSGGTWPLRRMQRLAAATLHLGSRMAEWGPSGAA